MKNTTFVLCFLFAFALFIVPGCDRSAEPAEPVQDHADMPEGHPPVQPGDAMHGAPMEDARAGTAHGGMPQQPSRELKVPDSVKGKWKAVKLSAVYAAGEVQEFEVPVGGEAAVPDSDLTVAVEAYLPSFFMDDKTISSVSNEEKNPAARIAVKKAGETIHEGWLFQLHPGAHGFTDGTLSLQLVAGVPAG